MQDDESGQHAHAALGDTLQKTIAALQAQREVLGGALTDAALAPLLKELARLGPRAAVAAPPRRLRQVSVLFCDIVGSTRLSETLGPEDWQSAVDGALAAFAGIVQGHGGEVLRYAGDNLKAAFGASGVGDDDAERAVNCGLALLLEAGRRGQALHQAHGHEGFDARVGIHTGAAVRGGGVEADSSLSGLAVNIAARLEQAAPPGGLLISVDTQRQVQGCFDVQEQPALAVKGLQEPLRSFRVVGVLERRLRGLRHGVDGVRSTLVGRDDELARLHHLAAAVFAAGGGLAAATVLGEAGLGKSRLLAEFQAGLPEPVRTGSLWRVSSHPQAQHQPFGLIRDLLFWHLGVRDSDSQQQAQQRLADGLAALMGAAAPEPTALLGQLVGLDYSASPFIAPLLRDGRQLRARGLNAWLRYLQQQAARQPLVLVLDDLQWADDDSLGALDQLVATAPGLPIVLVCAARPELRQRRPTWGASWPRHERVDLRPLASESSDTLAAALLTRFAAPEPALQQLLSAQAAGNPFYMEALLQMLVDTDVIQTSGEHWQWQPHRLSSLRVPSTLVGVLQATLDALDAAQRRSLQQASVVGPQFWDQALAMIEAQAPGELPALSARGLALPQRDSAFEGTNEYRFRHHLLHQVTYDTVLKDDKRVAHGQAALWLQARSPGREGELASQIAEHFERAGQAGQALHYRLRAAEDAVSRQADTVALAHTDRARALDDGSDLRRLVRLHQVRAAVFLRAARSIEHGQEVAALESLAERLDDDLLRLQLAYGKAWLLIRETRYDEAIALCEDRLARAGARAPADAARLHDAIAVSLVRLTRTEDAQVHSLQALALARGAGDRLSEANILNNMGVHFMEAERLSEALDCYGRSIDTARASGNRHGVVIGALNLAVVEETVGRFDRSRALYEQVLRECDEAGAVGLKGMASANLAGVLAELGEGAQGYDAALESLRLAGISADRRTGAFGHRGARMAASVQGRWHDALEHARAARTAFAGCGHPDIAWVEASTAARILSALGERGQALAEAEALLAEVAAAGGWGRAFEGQFNLYCVLAPVNDARALPLLEAAHRDLHLQADRYADLVSREAFLGAAANSRDICQAWAGASGQR
jgi:class 3 adenylate cyclase